MGSVFTTSGAPKRGGSPFTYTYSPSGEPTTFNVVSAVAQDEDTVRVTYDGEAYHASASNSNDSLNPDNYGLTSVTGKDRSGYAVTLIQASPTIVDVDLDGEMTNAATYTMAVSGVLRASDDEALTTSTAQCSGIGTLPRVLTVTAQSSGTIRVTFDEAMEDNADLVSTLSYTITGDTTLTKYSVSTVNVSAIDISVSEMKDGGNYTLTVSGSGVMDQAYNPVNTNHNSDSFTGIGIHPQVTTATATSSGNVQVNFSEAMEDNADLVNTSSYTITGDTTLTKYSVTRVDSDTVDISVSEMKNGGNYTVMVSTVVDLADNVIDPLNNWANFTGIGIAPQVVSAAAEDDHTVRITFDEEMANNAALVDTASYSITGDTALTPQSVTRVDGTHVDVTTTEEMQQGGAYTITVASSGVTDLAENPIDPAHDSADFTGVSTAPRVSTATALSSGTVRVVFNEGMDDNAALVSTSSYAITGATTLTINSVARVNATTIDLYTSEMLDGGAYTFTVASSGVTDIVGNPVDPAYNYADFTGVGILPKVSTVTAQSSGTIRVVFDEDMEDNAALVSTLSYTITGDTTLTKNSVTRINATTVDVSVSEMKDGGSYTLTVSGSGVVDLVGNPVDPSYNYGNFTGIGIHPQVTTATAESSGVVRVNFDEAMKENADLIDTASYTITGDTTLTKYSVSTVSASAVDISVSEMKNGGSYTVMVSTVVDLADNVIDPLNNWANFTGIGILPRVSDATAEAGTTVRVTYNEEMENNAALVDTSSYSITGDTSITVSNVTRTSGTVVDLTTNELQNGGNYTVTVSASGITDLAENTLDPAYNSHGFVGISTDPRVSSATAADSTTVRIVFNEEMTDDAELVSTSNYSVTGDTTISVSSVTRIDGTTVDLSTNEMKDGGNYTATVATSGITDLAGNPVDPAYNYDDFVGVGVLPQVSTATATASGTVRVVFNEEMTNDAALVSTLSYTITGDTALSKYSVTRINGTTVDISTSEMYDGGTYTVMVSGVTDLAENPIDPAHNYADFFGVGIHPRVSTASALTSGSVQVIFDEDMENNADLIDTNNYSITGDTTPTISLVTRDNATTVTLSTSEMKNGGTYTVMVSAVVDLAGNVIDPAYNWANFTGIGRQPRVSTATATTTGTVRVVFDEDMTNNADLTNTVNYVIAGPTVLTKYSVTRINATTVDVSTSEMEQGGSYTVTVSNVVDLADNVIDPAHNSAAFTGAGAAPQVLPDATVVDDYSVYVDYTEEVKEADATNTSNYAINPTLLFGTITKISTTRYKLTFTTAHETGINYDITVSNVEDIAGNPIDPAHDTASFTGTGPTRFWIAEILIGSNVVWSSSEDVTQRVVSIDVSQYTGRWPVKFRIRMDEIT